jgi:hypothetical protein
MKEEPGTGFIYCSHCRTLVLGLSAREYAHVCDPAAWDDNHPKPMQTHQIIFARRVVRI